MLSTRLLVRQPHNVVLTQSGLQIVTHARTMLEALRAIQQCAQQAGNAHAGKIRRQFPSAFSKLLPPLLRKFRRLYPDIELITLEGTDHEVESWLTSATADIGVVLNPAPERLCFPLGEDAAGGRAQRAPAGASAAAGGAGCPVSAAFYHGDRRV